MIFVHAYATTNSVANHNSPADVNIQTQT